MRFASPWWLLLLLFVLAELMWRHRRRSGEALGYSSLDTVKGAGKSWKQRFLWLPGALRTLSLIALVVAMARPQVELSLTREEQEGIAIAMLVDISTSMDMSMSFQGEQSTRLDVAKQVVIDFVAGDEDKIDGRPNDLIGLVTFARYADTVCPLTLAHEALVTLAEDIELGNRPNEDGTSYGDATALAAARLRMLEDAEAGLTGRPPIKSKVIILLTDGENNCGRHLPMQGAALAKEWGIRIYTVSIGDPPADGKQGEVPASRALLTLQTMAESTGGIFRTAHDFDSLQAVYQEIDKLEKSKVTMVRYEAFREIFGWLAFPALLGVICEQFLRNLILRRVP